MRFLLKDLGPCWTSPPTAEPQVEEPLLWPPLLTVHDGRVHRDPRERLEELLSRSGQAEGEGGRGARCPCSQARVTPSLGSVSVKGLLLAWGWLLSAHAPGVAPTGFNDLINPSGGVAVWLSPSPLGFSEAKRAPPLRKGEHLWVVSTPSLEAFNRSMQVPASNGKAGLEDLQLSPRPNPGASFWYKLSGGVSICSNKPRIHQGHQGQHQKPGKAGGLRPFAGAAVQGELTVEAGTVPGVP